MEIGSMAFNVYALPEIPLHYGFPFFIPSDKKMENTPPYYSVSNSYS